MKRTLYGGWVTAAVVLLAAMLAAPAVAQEGVPAAEQMGLAITPEEGSENPVSAGQLATLRIEGMEDWHLGRCFVWPEADLLPVLVAPPANFQWKIWGDSPALQFRAEAQGRYQILLLETADDEDDIAQYIVEVGEPLPPPDLVVEPAAPFLSSGPAGGPFSPLYTQYTITASQDGWTATVGDVDWLSIQQGSAYVRLSISPAADDLAEGTYETALVVALEDLSETRQITLTVSDEPPPPPPPPPGKKQVAFYVTAGELEELSAEQNEILSSLTFRDQLEEAGHKFIQVFSDEDEPDSADEQAWFENAQHAVTTLGLDPPLILFASLEGGDKIQVKPLPENTQGVWELIGGKP